MSEDIIAFTGYSVGITGLEKPTRIILHRFREEYVTHFQTNDNICFFGHYYQSLEVAIDKFKARVNNHNKDYPRGNPSHVGPYKILQEGNDYGE